MTAPSPQGRLAPRTLLESDLDRDIELGSGEGLVVELSSKPSTGYLWFVGPSALGDPEMELLPQGVANEGGSSLQRFTWKGFEPSAAGTLEFTYRRSRGAPERTHRLGVTVRSAGGQGP